MTDELEKVLRELTGIVNNFSITGKGVSGSLDLGYSVQQPNATCPTTGGGGGGCIFVVTVDFGCGLCSPGFLYVVGDILTPATVEGAIICPPGDVPPFELQVTSVDGGGAVTGVTIIAGIGYSSITSPFLFAFNGGSGFAFEAQCTFA